MHSSEETSTGEWRGQRVTICLGEHDCAEDRLAVNSGASKGQIGQWLCECSVCRGQKGAVCLLLKMLQRPDGGSGHESMGACMGEMEQETYGHTHQGQSVYVSG